MRYYIAYGSNMSMTQIKRRCPDVELVDSTFLNGYKLEFKTAYGTGAFATITPDANSKVPVVIFKISQNDERNLDIYEGVKGKHYFKEMIDVRVNNKLIRAMVYRMNLKAKLSLPSFAYIDTILEGYISFGFDTGIIDEAIIEASI